MGAWSYRVSDWRHAARACRFSSGQLASALGISHRQLQRHFQEVSGLKLRHWLNELRLQDSRHLLDGQHSVKEVAFLLSFKQHSHFTREFKKRFGMTPEAFSRLQFHRNPQFEREYSEILDAEKGPFQQKRRV